jgi:hypothetical protein
MKKIALFICSLLIINTSFAQWAGMGSGPGGIVRTLCVHNGELYAGGDFSGLVKKWSGSAWVAVGSLGSGKVNSLVSFNGSLYAGGGFTMSGKDNVAKFNGTTWASVGDGLAGVTGAEVKVLYAYNSALYAGGNFTNSGTPYCQKVAKLNSAGTAWAQAGGGAPSKCSSCVFAIAAYNGELYVGGTGSAPWMNKLDIGGQQWNEVASSGAPSSGTGVYALTAMKHIPNATSQTLIVGGDFTTPSIAVCKLSAGFWGTETSFQSGGKVNCFAASSNGLTTANAFSTCYAGGLFTGGTPATANITKRTNTVLWGDTIGTAFNAVVHTLCFFNGYLVAGGEFSAPGNNVARKATTVDVQEVSDNILANNVYPNPVIKEALLNVETRNKMVQPELKMLDVNGNLVEGSFTPVSLNNSMNQVKFRIDREGLASGIYYYMVLDEQKTIATGKVVIE